MERSGISFKAACTTRPGFSLRRPSGTAYLISMIQPTPLSRKGITQEPPAVGRRGYKDDGRWPFPSLLTWTRNASGLEPQSGTPRRTNFASSKWLR